MNELELDRGIDLNTHNNTYPPFGGFHTEKDEHWGRGEKRKKHMTNAAPRRSSSGASSSNPGSAGPSSASINMPPRHSSYASAAAAAGMATAVPPSSTPPVRAGTFSHLLPSTASSLAPYLPHPHDPDHRDPLLPSYASLPGAAPSSNNTNNGVAHAWGNNKGHPTPLPSDPYSLGASYGFVYDMDCNPDGFIRPTYLRESRYLEKLEAAHTAKVAAQREAAATATTAAGHHHHHPMSSSSAHHGHSKGGSSLSTSSSSVSLHRMAPSHRGMTYEIIEHVPAAVEEDGLLPPLPLPLPPLPSKWGETDRHGVLEVAADGLDIRYAGVLKAHDHEAAAARANHAMPPPCGLYYYEVIIINKGKEG